MIEERPLRLMAALESRVDDLLAVRREAREQHQARLAELEQERRALEARNAELSARAEDAQAHRRDLAGQLEALEVRLAEAEAARLELAEENRELDEQNRELEAHNRRLQARLDGAAPSSAVPRPHRQAKGLSALIGHHRPPADDADPPGDEPPPEAAAPAQSDLPVGEAPSPQALLAQWYQRYADTFFKGHTRPLKVGIHEELAAREPWPEKLVRRALACYVNLPRYLKSVREGAERIDLHGAPAGVVDAGAAEHARKKLERLQADRRRKGKPAKRRAPAPAGKPRPSVEASASPAPPPTPTGADEPDDSRLQRKLGELVARHNGR